MTLGSFNTQIMKPSKTYSNLTRKNRNISKKSIKKSSLTSSNITSNYLKRINQSKMMSDFNLIKLLIYSLGYFLIKFLLVELIFKNYMKF